MCFEVETQLTTKNEFLQKTQTLVFMQLYIYGLAQWACFTNFIKDHNYSLYSLVKNWSTRYPIRITSTQYIFFLYLSVFLRNVHLKSFSLWKVNILPIKKWIGVKGSEIPRNILVQLKLYATGTVSFFNCYIKWLYGYMPICAMEKGPFVCTVAVSGNPANLTRCIKMAHT